MKYVNYDVVFSEIPDETTLAINISNCPCHCKGCHSPYLAKDIGEEVTAGFLINLIRRNKGITCIAMMGGDASPEEIQYYSDLVRNIAGLKYAWYSGKQFFPSNLDITKFDYIKLGAYREEFGPLTSKTTNQRLFKIVDGMMVDITNKFWND